MKLIDTENILPSPPKLFNNDDEILNEKQLLTKDNEEHLNFAIEIFHNDFISLVLIENSREIVNLNNSDFIEHEIHLKLNSNTLKFKKVDTYGRSTEFGFQLSTNLHLDSSQTSICNIGFSSQEYIYLFSVLILVATKRSKRDNLI